MHYNEAQERAIRHTDGPMLVLAGPGSGKTAVITGRTLRLIRDGISPSSILVVTFTKAAATEMKGRFLKMAGTASTAVQFGTFHGVYYGILRSTGRVYSGSVLPEGQKIALLKEILNHLYPGAEQEADLPSQTAREISQFKGSRADIRHFYSAVLPQDIFRKVLETYESWKEENNKIDFDDIITRCYELFLDRPDVLEKWRERFRYLLLDEFQDISPLQYEIIKLLAAPRNNLFIVGDDDQSIYRFRGANPDLMLNFPKDYPDAAVVALSENYRSTPQILEASGRLIAKNKKRFAKTIEAARENGPEPEFELFKNPREECIRLAEDIRKRHNAGLSYNEIAVLVRTNMGCREAVEQMMAYQIPFRMGDTVPCVFDHWIANDVMAYMDLGHGSRRRADFLQIYNRPNRYFSREAFMDAEVTFESLYIYYEDRDWMVRRVEQLENDLRVIGHLSPYGALHYIRREVGYETYLREYANARNIPEEDLLQILDELTESARNYKTYEEWLDYIEEYRQKLQEPKKRDAETDGVMISTLHAAKGMEYDTVYILDVNEGMIPFHKAVLEADLEEERRMLYVGMTRAKNYLKLSAVKEKYDKKTDLSRFIGDIFPGGKA